MTEFERLDQLLDKIDQKADEITGELERIKTEIEQAEKKAIRQQYAEIADKMCKNYCIIPKLYCYDGTKGLKGMEKRCDNCPLVEGYKLCI